MKLQIVSLIVLITLITSQVVFAQATVPGSDSRGESEAAELFKVPSQEMNEKILLPKEEYDKKLKNAKTTMIVGGAMIGGGVALMAAGTAYVVVAANKKELFGGLQGIPVGAPIMIAGMGVGIAGIVTLVVGAGRKGHVKQKYYYSLAPDIDLERERYGLRLAFNF